MFGSGRFGKNRFAVGTPSVGISITPDTGELIFRGFTPGAAYVIPPLKVTWMGLEALHIGSAFGRVTWFGLETLHDGVASGRITWNGVEVLRSIASGVTSAIVTWFGVEALHIGVAFARVTWFGVEVLNNASFQGRVTWFGVEVLRDYPTIALHRHVSIIWGQ